jgi:hypothetical protein
MYNQGQVAVDVRGRSGILNAGIVNACLPEGLPPPQSGVSAVLFRLIEEQTDKLAGKIPPGHEVIVSMRTDVGCVRKINEDRWSYYSPEDASVVSNKLIALYRGASLFVMPSLDGGFGLPALEAIARASRSLPATNTRWRRSWVAPVFSLIREMRTRSPVQSPESPAILLSRPSFASAH